MAALRRFIPALFFIALAAATLKAAYYLHQVLILEARGAVESDRSLFLIVGRGLLNGLHAYADLFESKPPGMFFLFALSLLTTGDDRMALLLQISIFLAIPILLAGFAWWEVHHTRNPIREYMVTIIALVVGILLALYLEERAGSFKTESFGAFFSCLYLLHVFARREAGTKSAVLVNTCLLLGTFGMKEPFILSVLAGVLLVVRDPKHYLQALLIPLALAISTGTAVLAALGYLGPYLFLYLPAMLGARISANPLEPLWIRGFAVGRLLGNLTQFYSNPLFGGLLAFLWLMSPTFRKNTDSGSTLLLTLATSVVAYVFLMETQVFLVVLRAILLLPVSFGNAAAFLALRLAGYAMLLVILMALLLYEHRQRLMVATLLSCAALYLTCIAVGVAEYGGRHWGFDFPLLFAFALLFVRYAAREASWSIPVVTGMLLCLATALLYQPNADHLQFMTQLVEFNSSIPGEPLASRFDQLLDRCHISAYSMHGSHYQLALARHSPLGPVFALNEHRNYLPPDHPLLQQTYANIRDKAQLIVLGSGSKLDDILPDLQGTFTQASPPCTDGLVPLDHPVLLFRRR